jgi:hypothetical protein
MLEEKRKTSYWSFAIFVIFVVLLFVVLEENTSAPFSKCINNWHSDYGSDKPDQYGFFLAKVFGGHVLCTIKAVDRHNGFFAAIAGIAVACFTLSLRQSTDRLWLAGREALTTSERAFVFVEEFRTEITRAADNKESAERLLAAGNTIDPKLS